MSINKAKRLQWRDDRIAALEAVAKERKSNYEAFEHLYDELDESYAKLHDTPWGEALHNMLLALETVWPKLEDWRDEPIVALREEGHY